MITVSAPGKIHLLGEWSVVWGKPAILAAVGLRVTVGISKSPSNSHPLKKVIEPIVKKGLGIKTIPPYNLTITSDIPIGAGLGSSAAVSAACIAALLSYLKVKWDLKLINKLAYEVEKVFHGNPSGGDNSTVVYGGLVWFTRTRLNFLRSLRGNGFRKLAKNFVIINTGIPKETTKQMIAMVKVNKKFLDSQEQLVKELLPALKDSNEKELIRIIRAGEKNLESIGVVSSYAKSIIRKIEKSGGAGKICGAGGKTKATGVLLCYHPEKKVLEKIAKSYKLSYFSTTLGVEGVRKEKA